MIQITVNGATRAVITDTTLAELVLSLTPLPQVLATAVNGEFVSRHQRDAHCLRNGDAVFTFQPITGG